MGRPRLDTCRVCGAPRTLRAGIHRLCETHLLARWAQKKHHTTRRDNLRLTYTRLGLSVGNVWKMVL